MELDEGVDSSGRLHSDNAAQLRGYDPQKEASLETLVGIIASHEKLQRWNDATESALAADEKHEDVKLIQNVRNTAVLITLAGRSVSSQNFELMRAMNISDSTLSASALAKAFAEGVWDEIMSPVRALAEMQQPSDMNLEHAKKRAEVLENSILQIGSQALDVAVTATHRVKSALEHPENIANSLANAADGAYGSYQTHVDQLPKAIASGLMDKNAEQALGFGFGVAVVGMIRDTASKSGRLMRDFSSEMQFYPDEKDISGNTLRRVFYNPTEGHSINGYVDMDGQLHYHIIKSDGQHYGHGDEMFISMIEKFRQHGVDVHSIRDTWRVNGRDSTNGQQFLYALERGLSPEDAAFETFTGKHAKLLGLEHVVVPPTESGSPFKPIFTKQNNTKDQRSSLDLPAVKDVIIGQLKSLGLSTDKEQMAIAYVEKSFNNQSPEDSISV